MAHSRRRPSEINAGSMADIAFLLLIFFLVVSTMEKDVGINRKLPKLCPTNDCSTPINERNLLSIQLRKNNELMVNNDLIQLSSLRDIVKDFVDNNGDKTCNYCSGKQLANLSDHPKEAVISIFNTRETNYEWYIKVQDELVAAYFDLRKAYVKSNFGKPLSQLSSEELKQVKDAYPFQISEAELR